MRSSPLRMRRRAARSSTFSSPQTGAPPFNPRQTVKKFAALLREYGLSRVTGDAYAGQTFRSDFEDHGITYTVCDVAKSALYDAFEPPLNAGEVELLDIAQLQEQLLTLVWRGARIDHLPGDHDDWANAAAGAVRLVIGRPTMTSWGAFEWMRQQAEAVAAAAAAAAKSAVCP
jgi:hypothetical protein